MTGNGQRCLVSEGRGEHIRYGILDGIDFAALGTGEAAFDDFLAFPLCDAEIEFASA